MLELLGYLPRYRCLDFDEATDAMDQPSVMEATYPYVTETKATSPAKPSRQEKLKRKGNVIKLRKTKQNLRMPSSLRTEKKKNLLKLCTAAEKSLYWKLCGKS